MAGNVCRICLPRVVPLISFVRDGSGVSLHGQLGKPSPWCRPGRCWHVPFPQDSRPSHVLVSSLVCPCSNYLLFMRVQLSYELSTLQNLLLNQLHGGHCASPSSQTTMATRRQKIVSSGRLPNAQHSEFTLLERQQRSLGKVQRYLDAPVEEDILVNDNTKAHRQWLMRIWNK